LQHTGIYLQNSNTLKQLLAGIYLVGGCYISPSFIFTHMHMLVEWAFSSKIFVSQLPFSICFKPVHPSVTGQNFSYYS